MTTGTTTPAVTTTSQPPVQCEEGTYNLINYASVESGVKSDVLIESDNATAEVLDAEFAGSGNL